MYGQANSRSREAYRSSCSPVLFISLFLASFAFPVCLDIFLASFASPVYLTVSGIICLSCLPRHISGIICQPCLSHYFWRHLPALFASHISGITCLAFWIIGFRRQPVLLIINSGVSCIKFCIPQAERKDRRSSQIA